MSVGTSRDEKGYSRRLRGEYRIQTRSFVEVGDGREEEKRERARRG